MFCCIVYVAVIFQMRNLYIRPRSRSLACEHVNKPQTFCFRHTWLEMWHGAFTIHYMEMNCIKEISLALERRLVLGTVVVRELLSGTAAKTPNTPTHTNTNTWFFFLSLGRVKSLFVDFWFVDRRAFERGHLSCSSLCSISVPGICDLFCVLQFALKCY